MSTGLTTERTIDIKNKHGIMFSDMNLRQEIIDGLISKNFIVPSPIQEEAIPTILYNHDVLARSKNGTGKTASFVIPSLQKVDETLNKLQCLIIVPTRELAIQTSNICMDIAQFTKIKILAMIGGSRIDEDVQKLHDGVHILVSTPGRILGLSKKNILDLSTLKLICIDEADVVIQNNESELIQMINSKLKHKCQIALFSATFPRYIADFRDKYMRDAVEINTMNEFTLTGVTQYYALVEEKDKLSCIYTLLLKLLINQCIIFCNSVNRVKLLTDKIKTFELSAKCIHSKLPQQERTTTYEEFRRGNFKILVCSDVFNRGIDIQSVNVVINFDLPNKSATYLHRIGRSGRFGHIGLGISFVSPHNIEDFVRISAELKTTVETIPQNADIKKELYVSTIPTN